MYCPSGSTIGPGATTILVPTVATLCAQTDFISDTCHTCTIGNDDTDHSLARHAGALLDSVFPLNCVVDSRPKERTTSDAVLLGRGKFEPLHAGRLLRHQFEHYLNLAFRAPGTEIRWHWNTSLRLVTWRNPLQKHKTALLQLNEHNALTFVSGSYKTWSQTQFEENEENARKPPRLPSDARID